MKTTDSRAPVLPTRPRGCWIEGPPEKPQAGVRALIVEDEAALAGLLAS